MILVKSVDIEHVSGREAQIAIMNPIVVPCKDYDLYRVNHSNETVQARVFTNSKREEVIVGFSLEVQKALGMPMDAFQGMSEKIENLTFKIDQHMQTIYRLEDHIEKYKTASFLKRLKYLFRGKI